MNTPRLGIIGTGMISTEFAAAVNAYSAFEIAAVMSRSKKSAERFIAAASLGNAASATDISELVRHDLDAVYIASPNSLHYDHAVAAIAAGINVIVEKPAFWNPAQFEQVYAQAEKAGVLVCEAARHVFEPGFAVVKDWAADQEITGASFQFHQYSSRWDLVVAGEEPNIFSLRHGGGALTDLGIYAVYAAVSWFGEPVSISYYPRLAPTGVDASGVLLLEYPGFTAELSFSKNQASVLPSEIRAGQSCLTFNAVQGIEQVETASGEVLYRSEQTDAPLRELMRYEAIAFAELIAAWRGSGLNAAQRERYEDLVELSRIVNRVCTEARYLAGIFFTDE
jgi:hypothetical protein